MKLIASGVAICAGMTRSPSFSRSSSSTRMNIRPLRASSMICSALAITPLEPLARNFSSLSERVGGRIPVRVAELAQAVGMEAGGAGEAGAAHLAGRDEVADAIDQDGAHASRVSHLQCDRQAGITLLGCAPPACARDSGRECRFRGSPCRPPRTSQCVCAVCGMMLTPKRTPSVPSSTSLTVSEMPLIAIEPFSER